MEFARYTKDVRPPEGEIPFVINRQICAKGIFRSQTPRAYYGVTLSDYLSDSTLNWWAYPPFLSARTLEDIYGLTVNEADGDVCLQVNVRKGKEAAHLHEMLCAWKEQADKLSSKEISKEEYDNWRYHYPKFDTTQRWAKVPSQELSDALVEMLQEQLEPDK